VDAETHTEVHSEDLNLGYPDYEAEMITTTLQHCNIASQEFLILSPSDRWFSKEIKALVVVVLCF
jgi:hypothetical protein